jgi:hypothetical protein
VRGEGVVWCAIAIASVSSLSLSLSLASRSVPGRLSPLAAFLSLSRLTWGCCEPAGRSEVVVLAATSEMEHAAAGSGLQRPEKPARGAGPGAVVVVAVRAAAREISKTAAVWALTHVVQHGDSILLLVLIPPPSSGMCMHCIFTPLFFSFSFLLQQLLCTGLCLSSTAVQVFVTLYSILTHKQYHYHSAINLSVSMVWMYVCTNNCNNYSMVCIHMYSS